MRTGDARAHRSGAPHGYAYLLLLVLIAVLGVASSAAVSLGASMARRDAEQQLLVIGAAFQQALASHGGKPRELEELLQDDRVPGIRRHLRRIPIDPLTGRDVWGLVREAQGGIVGVHSLATGRPLKLTGFAPRWKTFEEASSYRDWVFAPLLPVTTVPPPPSSPR